MRKENLNILVAVCVSVMTLAVPAAAVTHNVAPVQSIQSAIDVANDGDEIEVAPGNYYEAIDFNGKAVRLYNVLDEEHLQYKWLPTSTEGWASLIDNDRIYRRVLKLQEVEEVMEGTGENEPCNPNPPHQAIDVPVDANLTWERGNGVVADEVYLGTDPCALDYVGTIEDPDPALYDPPGDLVASRTYYWQIVGVNSPAAWPGPIWEFKTVRGEAQPNYPSNHQMIIGDLYPDPPATPTHIYTTLVFDPGPTAVKHTGYFSEDYSKVAGRNQDANLGPPPYPTWPGLETTFWVGYPLIPPANDTLVRGTKYYWTVDETDAFGHTFSGDIWEFTIQGFYASAPSPPNEAAPVSPDVLLSWSPGYGAEEHDVYMGLSWEDVNNALWQPPNPPPPEYVWTVSEPNYQCIGLAFNTKYYWRIDEVWDRNPPSPYDVYKGPVWCFTTRLPHIFVDIDATGANDGSSWADAFNYLQDALSVALPGEEIYVGQGTYKPDQGSGITAGDRMATFQLINGVILKGGYAGLGQPDPNDRDVDAYQTVLSGDIGTVDNYRDNSYHVVTSSLTDATSILDGFTIAYGDANGTGSNNCGGGMYNSKSSPTVTNCTFSNNIATVRGGGIFNQENSNPTVTNCTFINNFILSSDMYGGGMCNEQSSPTVTNCTFVSNYAPYGGGMLNSASSPTVTNCTFSNNWADNYGGGMHNNSSNPTVTNCTFINNYILSSGMDGGGMYNEQSSPTVTNCTFVNNYGLNGGGMSNQENSNPTVHNCTFSDNQADTGGGMQNYNNCSPVLTNCIFRDNFVRAGGGMSNNLNSSSHLTNCIFTGNIAYEDTGGMSNHTGSNAILTNCVFANNSAVNTGGGIQNAYSTATLTNCTFSGNTAGLDGGGMRDRGNSNSTVTNCIFWGDTPDEIYVYESSPTVTYSNIQGGWGDPNDPNNTNIDANPCFMDPNNSNPNLRNLRLKPDSPCIDAGDSTVVLAISVVYDLDGKDRYFDIDAIDDTGSGLFEFLDMGAYEFDCSGITGDINCDGVVDFKDIATVASNWLSGTEPEL